MFCDLLFLLCLRSICIRACSHSSPFSLLYGTPLLNTPQFNLFYCRCVTCAFGPSGLIWTSFYDDQMQVSPAELMVWRSEDCVTLNGNTHVVLRSCTNFHSQKQRQQSSLLSIPGWCWHFFIFASRGWGGVNSCSLTCASLITNEVEHLPISQ